MRSSLAEVLGWVLPQVQSHPISELKKALWMRPVVIAGLFAFSCSVTTSKTSLLFLHQLRPKVEFFKVVPLRENRLTENSVASEVRLYLPCRRYCYPELGRNQRTRKLHLYSKSPSPVACSLAQNPVHHHDPWAVCSGTPMKGISPSEPESAYLQLPLSSGSVKQSSALLLFTESPLMSEASYWPCFRKGMLIFFLPIV